MDHVEDVSIRTIGGKGTFKCRGGATPTTPPPGYGPAYYHWWLIAGEGGSRTCWERSGAREAEGGAWGIWTNVARRSQASTATRPQCGQWKLVTTTQVHSAGACSSSCHCAVCIHLLAAVHRVTTIDCDCVFYIFIVCVFELTSSFVPQHSWCVSDTT